MLRLDPAAARPLHGMAFGSAVAGAACLLPPDQPLENDPLILLLLGLTATVASRSVAWIIGDGGLAILTLVLLLACMTAVPRLPAAMPGSSAGACLVLDAVALVAIAPKTMRVIACRAQPLARRLLQGAHMPRPTHVLEAPDPEWIGRYRVLDRLGEGGMGVVYRCRAPNGRLVAVKVIRHDLTRDPQFLARFRRELEAARLVPRRCTAQVLDADLDATVPYVVTEYVDGPTLQATIALHGPLPPGRLENVAAGIASALTAIHGAGVIHLDLTPSNIMLPPGNVVVVDFGIARPLSATISLARPFGWRGTPSFMAPEQFTGGKVVPTTDVFAWGGVVAFAGTGRPPFRGSSMDELVDRILRGEPELSGLDSHLRTLVEAALHKDPADRPSAEELLRRLLDQP